MIRFQCPKCGKVLKAPDNSAGRKGSCSRCKKRLLVPLPLAAPANDDNASEPDSYLEKTPPSSFSLYSIFVTLLACASPASLAVAFLFSVLYTVGHHRLTPLQKELIHIGNQEMPEYLSRLGILALLSMAGGLLVTATAFVLGVMTNNKLAIVLSSVTFVLSWPILCMAWFL